MNPFRPTPVATEPLRVCDLVQFHSPISGGVKRFVQDKCRFLAAVPGVEHCVIVPGPADGRELWGRSQVHTIASPRLIGSASYRVLQDSTRIREIVTGFRPHVIEVGDPYLCAWIGRRLGRRIGARVVGFYHSDYPRAWYRTVERFAGRGAGRIFERVVAAYLRRLYRGMDALVVGNRGLRALWEMHGFSDRLHLVPLGVDTTIFRPQFPADAAAVRAMWGIPMEARVLLYVGRLAREKRPALVRDVFHALAARHADVHLVFIGDGETRAVVQEWSRGHPRLHWRPYESSAAELARAYSAADVFVHAGLGETFGLSALEAQACGLPVVAARGSGMDDTILPIAPSALVGSDDVSAWAAAAERALQPEGADARAAARAHRHAQVQATYSWAATYSRLVALYAQLAGQPAPALPVGVPPALPA